MSNDKIQDTPVTGLFYDPFATPNKQQPVERGIYTARKSTKRPRQHSGSRKAAARAEALVAVQQDLKSLAEQQASWSRL